VTARPLQVTDLGDGQPVVLLHGQPGQGRDWEAVVRQLGAELRVIVPDRPGYGRTGGPAVGVGGNVDAVVELLDRLDLPTVAVVGHSWGGAVALDLVRRHPDRVSVVVLVASVGGRGSVNLLDRVLGLPVIGPAFSLVGLTAMRAFPVRRLLARMSGPSSADTASSGRWYSAWRSFVVEQRALVLELPGIVASLPSIRTPAVVMIGEADRVVPPVSQEHLATILPQAQTVRVAKVGHLLPQKSPQSVAEVILAATRFPGAPVPGAEPRLAN
jgi:pimeloyl-ACP methyl ester carboxylesterase